MTRAQASPGVKVRLPSAFQEATRGRRQARVSGHTVGEALAALVARYPALRPRLRSESGALRPFVLVFLNSEDIRSQQGEETALRDGDELSIVPAIEGG
jgi:molybdopterin synthase sulfur carrier subunit